MVVPITVYEVVETVRYVDVNPLDLALDIDATKDEIVEAVIDAFSGINFESLHRDALMLSDPLKDLAYSIRDSEPDWEDTYESYISRHDL